MIYVEGDVQIHEYDGSLVQVGDECEFCGGEGGMRIESQGPFTPTYQICHGCDERGYYWRSIRREPSIMDNLYIEVCDECGTDVEEGPTSYDGVLGWEAYCPDCQNSANLCWHEKGRNYWDPNEGSMVPFGGWPEGYLDTP